MKVRRIDFSADEWLGGTLELSPYDRGIYITVCALIYSRGEAVEIDLIRRHCGVHGKAVKAALARLSTAGKIELSATHASQGRCLEELSTSRLRMEKWAENLPQSKKTKDVGEPPARARARKPSLSVETPNGVSSPLGPPSASGRGKKRLSPIEGIAKGFADALANFPLRDGSADNPPVSPLLDGAGAGSVTPLYRRGLA